jgi:hypothetical protein
MCANQKVPDDLTVEPAIFIEGWEEFESGEAAWTLSLSPEFLAKIAEELGQSIGSIQPELDDHLFRSLSVSVRDAVEGYVFRTRSEASQPALCAGSPDSDGPSVNGLIKRVKDRAKQRKSLVSGLSKIVVAKESERVVKDAELFPDAQMICPDALFAAAARSFAITTPQHLSVSRRDMEQAGATLWAMALRDVSIMRDFILPKGDVEEAFDTLMARITEIVANYPEDMRDAARRWPGFEIDCLKPHPPGA